MKYNEIIPLMAQLCFPLKGVSKDTVVLLRENIKQHFGRPAKRPRSCGALQGAAKYSILCNIY